MTAKKKKREKRQIQFFLVGFILLFLKTILSSLKGIPEQKKKVRDIENAKET